ncbi:MAG: peptidylprolyl isomerase [Pseudomonadota bacterium]
MNKTLIRFALLLAALMLSLTGSAQLVDNTEPLDRIVAVVNEGVVLQSELDAQIQTITDRIRQAGQAVPPQKELTEQILERLIVDRLQLQRADRMGIRVSDEMLNNALNGVASRNGIAFEDLPAMMESEGLSYAVYREDMRQQLVLDQLRQVAVFRRINITDRELEQCVARSAESLGANAEFNLSHILIGVGASATAEDYRTAEARANDLYQQLSDGADFASIAITNSTSETALEGGALGWRAGNQVPTLFAETVAGMNPGDVSEPIRSGSGFHLVRLNETRGVTGRSEVQQTQVRHILVRPNEILDEAAAQQKLEEIRSQILAGQDFSDLAKLNSDDPGSGNLGGDLGWSEPGTFVPEFDEVVESLEINELSGVVRTRFGFHIIEVLGRRVYDNTEEVKRNECNYSLRNARMGEETELWLRRLRDEAFVDKRI